MIINTFDRYFLDVEVYSIEKSIEILNDVSALDGKHYVY